MKNRVEIEIDGKKLLVEHDKNVLEAALDAGRQIPHFCYHKKLSITASCRMCMVDVDGAPRPQPACATPVAPGMVVHTHTHRVIEAQKAVMEFLLINHPLDCPVCDQAGECRLQDLSFGYGSDASRYREEKRIVMVKDAGPLISMQEMNRCIHCTRCIRFGEEIAGMQELGMRNRSDHAEIVLAVGKTLMSELSGNMIDLCPVGALTSRPFRFRARNWELARHHSISPHDSLGSNLVVQTLNDQVMRVLPQENESINECWISDRDRFSYEGLNSAERLTKPMVKQDNQWIETDWASALDYIVHGLKDICRDDGADALAALASPQATLEEMLLLKKVMNGLGSANVDYRLRQADFTLDGKLVPWLGMPVTDIDELDGALIIGSFLRKEQPLLAVRFRRAAARGALISSLHGQDDDWLMPVAHKMIAAPSQWPAMLAEVVAAVAKTRKIERPQGFEEVVPSVTAREIAMTLVSGGRHAIFMGNVAAQHPRASELHTMAEWLAKNTGARLGYLADGANTAGGYLISGNEPDIGHTKKILTRCHQAYLLLHTEPELDAANPLLARQVLLKAKMVVVMSPYRHGADYADVMLPVSPFTETSGTYINCEGRVQSFQGVVRPLGETRPAWKVLRVLGNLLELEGFEYDSSEEIRNAFLDEINGDPKNRLNNFTGLPPFFAPVEPMELERLTDVPLCFADAIVRRAASLQETSDGMTSRIYLPVAVCEKLGIAAHDFVTVRQGEGNVLLSAIPDETLPDNVARVYAGHASTAMLGPMFGLLHVRVT
ncbi:NADH-quinone oxidoreductase subunit NuoG [Oxalobacter sp. OttesenSCG-928-P03]|nr:NADH-quinone oxidoreductase subunit NuoG [Oxalobacter sp. OttesenSCG-928-P03]